jgi:maltooligosyltrehalose trehalohydrolase
MTSEPFERRMPIGAECLAGSGVQFRVWAPKRSRVEVVLESGAGEGTLHPLSAEGEGYFRCMVGEAKSGTLYRFRLDGERELYPDPASRAQPAGPHGPSQVVDPSQFDWSDAGWKGVGVRGQVIYEMHVGTFSRDGTWAAAMAELPELASLGVTVIEVMPIAEFPGRFGWGYDGVNLFAPTRLYGSPDDVRRFVDRAHALGVGVILDVVYNHIGPDGNYLSQFSEHYFTDRHKTDWGPAINYDGVGSGPVRELVIANAAYWIAEFHFDGLRLDATDSIYDASDDHILLALARRVRQAAPERATLLIGENEAQVARLVRGADRGGYGLDALWNDDFHHAARVALTGRNEAYYLDYCGTPQELVSALKYGFLYQGQRSAWRKVRRGTPAFDIPPERFITFLENHDQVANTARGERLHLLTSRAKHRALATLVLLGPGTPMLFQGEEFAASSPFVFFADHTPELAEKVRAGRQEFMSRFPSIARPEASPDDDAVAFERCKLDVSERTSHAAEYTFYRELIFLRRHDPVFGQAKADHFDGAVLTSRALVLRYFGPGDDDRLILVNLGPETRLVPAPEPLLAPPLGRRWEILFSSENPRYGGAGTPAAERDGAWHLPGEAAVAFRAATIEKL